MKITLEMKIITTSIYLFTFFFVFSQNGESDINVDEIYGTWRIDSSAENRTYNIRNAINEEFFVFMENGSVNMEKIEDENINSFPLGTFTIATDTLKIRTLKGAPGMNFVITKNSEVLQLDGTFPISESNSRKPTLFLSKKKLDENNLSISIYRSDNQLIYRNVLNNITITPLEAATNVDCPYCDTMYKSEFPNQYYIKPSKGRVSEIIISDSSTANVLEKHKIKNSYLPDPILFYGASKNGTKCSKNAHHIFAKYPPEMNINLDSEIIKWEIHIDANTFSGEGNQLTEDVIAFLETYEGNGVISIIAVVRTADGIARKLGGAFSL
jgi:hypothetical protein